MRKKMTNQRLPEDLGGSEGGSDGSGSIGWLLGGVGGGGEDAGVVGSPIGGGLVGERN